MPALDKAGTLTEVKQRMTMNNPSYGCSNPPWTPGLLRRNVVRPRLEAAKSI